MQASAYFDAAKSLNVTAVRRLLEFSFVWRLESKMIRTKTTGIVVAIACAFVASSLWYSPVLFGRQFLQLSGFVSASKPSIAIVASEMLRNLLLASAISWILARQGPPKLSSVLGFAAALFLGFPVVLLSGSVMWQHVPVGLALIHCGDWLIKILLMTLIPWAVCRNAEIQSRPPVQDHAARPARRTDIAGLEARGHH